MEGAGALGTVLEAQGVEEGTQRGEARSLEVVRGPAACGEVEEGSCCSPAEGTSGVNWEVGRWMEGEVDPEAVLRPADRRGDDTAGSAAGSWAAWGCRVELLSSSWTAGFGSPRPTCRSWWWT